MTDGGLVLSAFIHNLDAGNEFKHGGIGLEFKFKVIKEQPAKSLNRSSLIQRYWRV